LVAALHTMSERARRELNFHIWFVEILGRRWSYIAGVMDEEPPQSQVARIPLRNNIGAVSDSWELLPKSKQKKLIDFLKQKISEKREEKCRILLKD